MMRIAHVSTSKRSDGCKGGVEKFAMYLQRATGCDILYPHEVKQDTYDIIVAEGAIASQVKAGQKHTVSVVHGTWAEFCKRNNVTSFGGDIRAQHDCWNNKDIVKVAVSKSAAKYLHLHHGVTADKIILNGVDTKEFFPIDKKPTALLHAATDYNKTAGERLDQVTQCLNGLYPVLFLNAGIGEEPEKFRQGNVFLQCSRYEGNSYAALEAMATGLPVVATSAGLFEDLDVTHPIGEILPWTCTASSIARTVLRMEDQGFPYEPRAWVENNASYEKFASEWTSFLESL